jgi:polyphosphate kinase
VPGVSAGISVRSVVGRFLEHSRIFRFGTGPDAVYLLGSADLMERNLDRRVEVLAPIRDVGLRQRLDEILGVLTADNVVAWTLDADGVWQSPGRAATVDAQMRLEQAARDRARRVVAI